MTVEAIYRDPAQPVEARVADLLSRMTLEEKVGQLTQLDGRVELEANFREKHPGSFLHVMGESARIATELARGSRLGIPLLLGIDAIHGHSFWNGATIFPTQLAMACSWDETLIETMAGVTAREMRHTGVAWTFSPVLCLTRDLRWGRVGETFGEDPLLIGRFAAAMIHGYQGDNLADPDHVLACAKHYAGYSETQGGRDASEADISRRKLRSYFLPPFRQAVAAGVGSFMTGYQSMEGLPSTANRWLLREVLKEEWGFDGILVTDWNNVGSMVETQRICPDYKTAAALAVQSGNDLMMSTPKFWQGCIDAVREGLLDETLVDEAVKRVLRIKFRLGLFEDDRCADPGHTPAVGCAAHRAVALTAARETAVLLQNNGLLPLTAQNLKKIAVVGPNADHPVAQLGDWSLGTGQTGNGLHPRELITTVLDGMRQRFAGEVLYAPGCALEDGDAPTDLEAAVAAAREADVTVAVVGDRPPFWGEWHSTATLELVGEQNELLRRLRALGKPLIVVLVHSKPQVLPVAVQEADAIVEQFSPGMLGGQALAELLFGDFNPSGRLTISVPYHVGQQPIYYSQVRGQHGDRYADLTQQPLFAFGEGLSYTTFEYADARLDRDVYGPDDTIHISVDVTNTGTRDGVEVVQFYLRDLVTSATWVDFELKEFARVAVKAGATVRVTAAIPAAACTMVNAAGERVVEPGDFELLVGRSSRDFRQTLPFAIK
ncbi:MAG: glycoside hydrolase family 3 N-terminal domain-containing protein [Victivallales bacterium]|nr:glycoside hydrolase family 3 N-terminal domain-containing protein [Victivallales bacterium]